MEPEARGYNRRDRAVYLGKRDRTVPILRDFERRLGNMVEGFFATAFRSGLQPVELAKRLLREMDSGKTVGVRDVWAPNHFVFVLSPSDRDRFEQAEQALIAELKRVVRDGAAERGWGLLGPPEVSFETNDSLGKGKFRCEASLVEGEDQSELLPASAGDVALVMLENGEPTKTYRLRKEIVTLGRLAECDVVIPDPGASRRHARIRHEDGTYVLTDLGSTNGTLVNDEAVRERRLEDGDRITIGATVLEFRRA
ncbi:MAG: FhaA domain-containing protein [Actinomycetota bacterium]